MYTYVCIEQCMGITSHTQDILLQLNQHSCNYLRVLQHETMQARSRYTYVNMRIDAIYVDGITPILSGACDFLQLRPLPLKPPETTRRKTFRHAMAICPWTDTYACLYRRIHRCICRTCKHRWISRTGIYTYIYTDIYIQDIAIAVG